MTDKERNSLVSVSGDGTLAVLDMRTHKQSAHSEGDADDELLSVVVLKVPASCPPLRPTGDSDPQAVFPSPQDTRGPLPPRPFLRLSLSPLLLPPQNSPASVPQNGKKVVSGSQEGVLFLYSWGYWNDCSDRFPGHPNSIDAMVKVSQTGGPPDLAKANE